MPADPIEFQIVKSLQAALKLIKTANGYHYTAQGQTVKLDPDHEVEKLIPGANSPIGPPRPFFVLDIGQSEAFEYEPANQVLLSQPFAVFGVHDTDPSEDEAKLSTHYKLCSDIEKALAVDITRGGLATDTRILNRRMHDREGQEVWAEVSGVVRQRRTYGAPNG